MSANMLRQWESRFNSFNSMKALVHVNYWKQINEAEKIPTPIQVSVDPCGVCNLKCGHCNGAEILRKDHTIMNEEMVSSVVGLLSKWGTKAACIGGGGESLINKNTYKLINELKGAGISPAVITNGTMLGDCLESILKLTYLGVSVDSATNETWQKVKGTDRYSLDDILKNMEFVCGKGVEVTYKYLLLPTNYKEVYDACRIAKNIGCDQFHLRPAAPPWFENERSYDYTEQMRVSVGEQLDRAREDFECGSFRIFAVMTNFSNEWKKRIAFKKCWAIFTTCFISPNGNIGLCCDRRGDDSIVIGNVSDGEGVWGSEKHRKIQDEIKIDKCPRCTYANVNEIFENVILKDKMLYNFF